MSASAVKLDNWHPKLIMKEITQVFLNLLPWCFSLLWKDECCVRLTILVFICSSVTLRGATTANYVFTPKGPEVIVGAGMCQCYRFMNQFLFIAQHRPLSDVREHMKDSLESRPHTQPYLKAAMIPILLCASKPWTIYRTQLNVLGSFVYCHEV